MHLKSFLSALAIAMALVVGLDYISFAATGRSLMLGRANSARATTSLTRTTNGPALTLKSRAGQPGLAVNGSTKVANLNADLLDGVDSSALARRQEPQPVLRAPEPSRSVALSRVTVVRELPLTVGSECGAATRHRYLVEQSGWWSASPDGNVEMSLTLNSTAHQFGPGSSVASLTPYGTATSSRVFVLAAGPVTFRLLADGVGGGNFASFDASLQATDLGYTCTGGPVSRPVPGRSAASLTGGR